MLHARLSYDLLTISFVVIIYRSGPSRRLIGDKSVLKNDLHVHTSWTPIERKILVVEMVKHEVIYNIQTVLLVWLKSVTRS